MFQAGFVVFSLLTMVILMGIPPIRWLILKLVPPGSGPSEEQRRNGFAVIYLVGKGTDSVSIYFLLHHVIFSGQKCLSKKGLVVRLLA